MKILLTTTAILTASTAMADGVNYGRLSYDFTRFENDDNELDLGLFQGAIEYQVSEFLLFGDLNTLSLDNDGIEADLTTVKAGAGYILSPEALIGAGILRTSVEDEDFDGFEVFGQYQTAQFGVGLNISVPDTDFDDETVTQFFGEYAVAPGIDLGVSLASYSEFDGTDYKLSGDYAQGPIAARAFLTGNTDADRSVFGLRGSYAFSDQIRAAAAFDTLSDDENDIEANFFSLGGGYKITEGVWVDADYGVLSVDDQDEVDRLQLAVTFETGNRTRIDDRFGQDATDDNQSGLGTLLSASF